MFNLGGKMPRKCIVIRNKNILLFLICAISLAMASPSRAAVIERITGKIEKPELAIDGSQETAAILKRAKTDPNFDFIIYLKDASTIKSVSLTANPTAEGAKLFSSDDIASWKEIQIKAKQLPAKNGTTIELTPTNPFQARYLRIKFLPGKSEKILLYEISAQNAPASENTASDIHTENVTQTGADILYKTLAPSATQVRIGAGRPVFDQVFAIKELTSDHKVILNNLTPGTDYFFQVILDDINSVKPKTSPVVVFRTAGEPLPAITKIDFPAPKPDSATINLKANVPVKWRVRYGLYTAATTVEYALNSKDVTEESSEGFLETTSFEFTGLKPRSKYFLIVIATDNAGRDVTSDMLGFETTPVNLALKKLVRGTFTNELADEYIEASNQPLKRVTDGDENYFSGFAKAWPTTDGPQWVSVDLGSKEQVATAVIVWSALAVPEDYTISTSPEGTNWTDDLKIVSGKADNGPDVKFEDKNSENGDPLIEVTVPLNKEIRFLALSIPKNAAVNSKFGWKTPVLAEIKALAP